MGITSGLEGRFWPDLEPFRAQTTPSGACRSHQGGDPEDGDGSPEVIGKRGQAKFAADLFKPLHQESALVHPLLDRAERMLDGFAPQIENAGAVGEAPRYAIEPRFAFPSFDAPRAAVGAL